MNIASALWQGLLANLATVTVLTLLWTQAMRRMSTKSQIVQSVVFGMVMGFGALVVMQMPFQRGAGFRLDHRFTIVATAGFFGGPISLAIAATMTSAYRLYIGGIGAIPGLIGIAISSLIGLTGYLLSTKPGRQDYRHIVGFSIAVPSGVIAGLFILPHELWPTSRPDIAIPLGATIFLATLCCALAIHNENQRLAALKRQRVYAAIINALPDCLNVKDTDGRFIAANPATAQLMQSGSAEKLVGKTDFDFYPQLVAETFRKDEMDFMSLGNALTVDQMVVRENGQAVHLSTLKAPLRDESGALVGIITHNRDVTAQRALEADLLQVRLTLHDAITNMNDGLAIYDHRGKMTFCNEQYRAMFPLTSDVRVPGAMLSDILTQSIVRGERSGTFDENNEWFDGVMGSRFTSQEDLLTLADGRLLQVKSVSVTTGVLLLISDVTAEKHAEAAITAAAREYQALFDSSVAGIFRSTIEGKMLKANAALVRLNGFTSEEELIGAVNDIGGEWYVDPNRRHEFVRMMAADGRVTDFVSQVYRFKTRERIWISETAWQVEDGNGQPLYFEGTITEITDRKHAEEALEDANQRLYADSRTDGLTGLGNRRAFDDCLAMEFERARSGGTPLSLLMIDVDNFKKYNDAYGHPRGDECLCQIATVMASIPRVYGDKLCRYGGEELAIILPDTDESTAMALAERLCRGVSGLAINHTGSAKGVVTVSIGVATLTSWDDSPHAGHLTMGADEALYAAKAAGRDTVVCASEVAERRQNAIGASDRTRNLKTAQR